MRRVLDGQPGWTDCSDTDASFYWLRYRGYVTCASVTVRSTRDADIAWGISPHSFENTVIILTIIQRNSQDMSRMANFFWCIFTTPPVNQTHVS